MHGWLCRLARRRDDDRRGAVLCGGEPGVAARFGCHRRRRRGCLRHACTRCRRVGRAHRFREIGGADADRQQHGERAADVDARAAAAVPRGVRGAPGVRSLRTAGRSGGCRGVGGLRGHAGRVGDRLHAGRRRCRAGLTRYGVFITRGLALRRRRGRLARRRRCGTVGAGRLVRRSRRGIPGPGRLTLQRRLGIRRRRGLRGRRRIAGRSGRHVGPIPHPTEPAQPQLRRERGHRFRPVRDPQLQRVIDCREKPRAVPLARRQLARRERPVRILDAAHDRGRRQLAGDHRVHHRAERIQVGPRPLAERGIVGVLLDRRIAGLDHHRAVVDEVADLFARRPEVEQDRVAVRTDQHVVERDVAMEALRAMQRVERAEQRGDHVAQLRLAHLHAAVEQLLERAPLVERHHHVRGAVALPEMQDLDEPRMIELREQPRFVEERAAPRVERGREALRAQRHRVVAAARREHRRHVFLDRDRAPQRAVERPIDDPEAADAEHLVELQFAEPVTKRQRPHRDFGRVAAARRVLSVVSRD
ncbi:hypothetical protein BUB20358_02819 [Burkholderia ubonensis]|nr:hypothetical protein BUB20358_02819 [Burkholderia ubonensis]